MKFLIKLIAILIFTLGSAETMAQHYAGSVIVRSNTMTEKDDMLNLSISVWVKQNSVQPYAAIRLTPKLVSSDNVEVFPDLMILGSNKNKTYNRWLKTMSARQRKEYKAPLMIVRANKHIDTTLTYNIQIPFQAWMEDAVLAVNQELITYNDRRSLVVYALDGRVKMEPRVPYRVNPRVDYVEPAAEKKRRQKQGQAFLDFQVAKSEIIPSYRRNPEELSKIRAAFREIASNQDVTINRLFIEGYASPEGRSEINEKLSRERAIALKDYILQNFYVPLTESQIRVSWVGEDWGGLKSALIESDLARAKELVGILDQTPDPAQRKQRLQTFASGSFYPVLLAEIFPKLRRVEYQIDYSVRDYSLSETRNIASARRYLLSQQELYLLAQSYGEQSPEFEDIILNTIPKQFPDDATGAVNAAVLLIRRGEYSTAERILDTHVKDSRTWNNLGVIYLLRGELDKAQSMLEKAVSVGDKLASDNLQQIQIKRDDIIKMQRR